jgi:cytochrome P450
MRVILVTPAEKASELLEVYGPCISTADWANWPRHRKILAAPFNESVMKFVWEESLNQAAAMIDTWVNADDTGIASIAKDTRTLSLNVLAATGFRRSYKFRGSTEPMSDEASSYRDALQTVLDNVIMLMLISPKVLQLPFVPASWARIGKAAARFQSYMNQMLDEEISFRDKGQAGSGSLMTSFVRALDTNQKEAAAAKGGEQFSAKGLSVDEIFGNIFVINFAGHDTTANTLAFSMLLLAAYPEVQDWVSEEVKQVTKSMNVQLEYDALFPKLKRCRAVLVSGICL